MTKPSENRGRFIIDPKTRKRRPATEAEAAIAAGTVIAPPVADDKSAQNSEASKSASKGAKS